MDAMHSDPSLAKQAPTPELRAWIVEQARAGGTPEQLLEAMKRVGWNEDAALDAMEEALRAEVGAAALAAWTTRQDPAPTSTEVPLAAIAPTAVMPKPMPEPNLTGLPLYIDAGDRRVHVLQVVANPRVVLFGNFLSDEECAGVIAQATVRLAPSKTVNPEGGEMAHPHRTSSGMFFKHAETPLIRTIEERIAKLVNWPIENGEAMQVLQYLPGAEYRPHYDYFGAENPSYAKILARGGQRVGTFLMYLGEPEAGGGTVFPDIGLEVAPKRGNALFFSYPVADPSSRSLHGGQPVVAGEKWVATKWLREGRFQ